MSEAIARRPDGLQRLTEEVRLARGIAHPNICRVYDIGYAEGWHYFSMEYVDGETLASLFRRIGKLPIPKAVEMARQLCAGVEAAHARGVLHRDLKPSNIMVDGRGQIRITDFGLAVTAADDVREVAGTPVYMSPEQLAGERVTVRSDLYSLGRVLDEMLPAGVDPRVSSIVQACMASDPAKRPESAYEVAAALPPVDSLGTSRRRDSLACDGRGRADNGRSGPDSRLASARRYRWRIHRNGPSRRRYCRAVAIAEAAGGARRPRAGDPVGDGPADVIGCGSRVLVVDCRS